MYSTKSTQINVVPSDDEENKDELPQRVATSIVLAETNPADDTDNDEATPLEDTSSNTSTKPKKKKFYIKFIVLSLAIITKSSSLLDSITDVILLYKASNNEAKLFTMILFISLLSPYVLSYSSGIELFLYRRTFENVKFMTFRSILLFLYLIPTGIMYFIIIDIVDALVECYKWFAFNIIYCCKREEQLVLIESTVAEGFGMSRMNWISFKKQKRIAQLFFETIPQVTLQVLLFSEVVPGKDLTGVTDRELKISIASAVLNSVIQIFKLYAEAVAVEESFVRYSLDNITARYSWVPFMHKIHRFYNQENVLNTDVQSTKYWGIKMKSTATIFDIKDYENKLVKINYKIKYRYPFISWINASVTGSVQYDFSSISIETLIAVLKSYRNVKNGYKLQIQYGESLRLLGMRDIIKLMQTCADKNILLPDIACIDWTQAFNNDSKEDTRLYSHHFDDANRPLLISLYLTQYDNKQFDVLKAFISVYDVPVNVQDDNGNTIVHHMVRDNDMKGLKALFEALKFNERLHLSEVNNAGETVMYLALQRDLKLLTKINTKDSKKINIVSKDIEIQKNEQNMDDIKDGIEMKDEEMDEFQKHWIAAVRNINENKIHPCTLINILYLKVNRMRMNALRNCKSNIDQAGYIQLLKSKLIVLQKQFNDIMSENGNSADMVIVPKMEDIFVEKKEIADNEKESLMYDVVIQKLMHVLLLKRNTQINGVIYNNQTVLGFVLINFIDFVQYIDIINYLLEEGAQLLSKEIHSFAPLFVNIASRSNCDVYFDLFSRVMDQSGILATNVADEDKNNPLHIAIKAKEVNALNDDNDTGKYIQIFCLMKK